MNRRTALKTVAAGTAALLGLPLTASPVAWNGYYKRKNGTVQRVPMVGQRTVADCWREHASGYGPEWAWLSSKLYPGRPATRKIYRDQRPLLWRPVDRHGTQILSTREVPLDDERFHDRLRKAIEYHVETVCGREITYLRSYTDHGELFWGAWDTTVPVRIQCIAGLGWTTLGFVREDVRIGLPKYWLPDRPTVVKKTKHGVIAINPAFYDAEGVTPP